ncbi:Xaa-Pro peptidase family protein [Bradyrhizobium sp. SRL28]|uniref:M24 family metallopeptidase n=1 Tax=Bradyrhizobium sp. SRL28 TaxID=2836178 RepID=UPI001BDE7C74|nr:Xaa-Pro peptidase family protein [Bradyrhizobium sp. SRL28]MBT1517369.1 Xaa-Pro peptidase family protein [Bradyrhizobium sp. SRL28]
MTVGKTQNKNGDLNMNDAERLFKPAEYARRVTLVRDAMRSRGIDLMLVHTPENLFYLSGYDTSGYFAYQFLALPIKGEPEILTRRGEAENARRSTVEKRSVYFDLDDVVAKTVEIVRRFPDVRRIGIEKNSWFLTVEVYERLRRELEPAQLVDVSNIVDTVRLVKSAPEIDLTREAANIATQIMAKGIDSARVGATENSIAAAISATGIALGSDYTGIPHLIKSGERNPIGHAQWSRRRLDSGDVLFMELSGCVSRYSAATMRTCQIRPEDKQVRKASETVITALDQLIAAIKPGATTGDLYNVAVSEIVKAGFGPTPRRMGYSLGIGYPPRWGEWHVLDLQPNGQAELKSGMILHLIPGVVLNPRATIGFSETVLVTDAGNEVLTGYDREFKVVS